MMVLRDFIRRYGAYAGELPLSVLIDKFGAEEGRLEKLEELGAEPVVTLCQIPPKVHAQSEDVRLDRPKAGLNQLLELLGHQPDDTPRLHILDGGDAGQGTMTTSAGEQRDVIPQALVAIGTAEVE